MNERFGKRNDEGNEKDKTRKKYNGIKLIVYACAPLLKQHVSVG